MNIQATGGAINHGRAIGLMRKASDDPESIKQADEPKNEPASAIEPDEQETADDGQGVLRLLQEGHFKGVADVRLRINFHDELSAMQNDALKDVVAEQLPALADSIGAQADAVLATDALTDNQTTAINAAFESMGSTLNQLTDEFVNAEAPSRENLVLSIRSEFDNFMTSLQGILIPDDTIEPDGIEGESELTEDIIETEETAVAAPDYQSFLDALTESFESNLADLINTLNSTNTLPELSQPSGNGKAYDKFLAMYNGLWGVEQNAELHEMPNADLIA